MKPVVRSNKLSIRKRAQNSSGNKPYLTVFRKDEPASSIGYNGHPAFGDWHDFDGSIWHFDYNDSQVSNKAQSAPSENNICAMLI
jgi:hypothetical protein